MPVGFRQFSEGCAGLPALGFLLNDAGCAPADVGFALHMDCGFTCPLGQFAEVEYDGSTAISGPAIRISDTSSRDSAVLLAALYVPAQAAVALVLWSGESLASFTDAMIVHAVSQTLNAGDVLGIHASDTDAHDYVVKVNGVAIIARTVLNEDLSIVNSCVGFVVTNAAPADVIPPPPAGEQAMIANQAADLDLTSDVLSDTDLTLAMEANSTYVGHVLLRYSCASAVPDMKVTFTVPALADGKWFDAAFSFETFDFATELVYSVSAGFDTAALFHFTVRNGANVGDLKFRVAQNVTNATPLKVKQDSHMLMFKKV